MGEIRRAALAALVLAGVAVPASAQLQIGPPTLHQSIGLYLGVGGAWNHLVDRKLRSTPGARRVEVDEGWLASGHAGYDFGWLRLELEGGYRENGTRNVSLPLGGRERLRGDIGAWYGLVNAIVDIDTGTRLTPYVGVGVGAAGLKHDFRSPSVRVNDSDVVFAYQAIGGLTYNFTPNFAANLDYRYFRTTDGKFRDTAAGTTYKSDYESHAVMVGLTYRFGSPPPRRPDPAPVAVAPRPRPAPPPAPTPRPPLPREFIVFFDFDRATLTPAGRQVVADAAAAVRAGQTTRIRLTGHTDTSGPARYNEGLSRRRAETVHDELVRLGVDRQGIATAWSGERQLRVQTPDGVREPQNRRVEIVLN